MTAPDNKQIQLDITTALLKKANFKKAFEDKHSDIALIDEDGSKIREILQTKVSEHLKKVSSQDHGKIFNTFKNNLTLLDNHGINQKNVEKIIEALIAGNKNAITDLLDTKDLPSSSSQFNVGTVSQNPVTLFAQTSKEAPSFQTMDENTPLIPEKCCLEKCDKRDSLVAEITDALLKEATFKTAFEKEHSGIAFRDYESGSKIRKKLQTIVSEQLKKASTQVHSEILKTFKKNLTLLDNHGIKLNKVEQLIGALITGDEKAITGLLESKELPSSSSQLNVVDESQYTVKTQKNEETPLIPKKSFLEECVDWDPCCGKCDCDCNI